MVDRMNLSEFTDYAAEHIREYMPDSYHDAAVTVNRVLKDGDEVYTGLSLRREGETQYPRVYLEGSFHDYLNGKELELVMKDLAEEYCQARGMGQLAERAKTIMKDRDAAVQHLSFRLVNRDQNHQGLENRPWRPMGDLALIYSIELGSSGRLPVDNKLASSFELDEDTLFEAAFRYSPDLCPAEVLTMGEALGFPGNHPEDMLVISNTEHADGASAILYPGVAENIRDRLGGDFYILPSSVHEILAIPKQPERLEELNAMVKEINRSIVNPRDFLSDHVYEHNGRDLSIAREEPSREHTKPAKSQSFSID